MFAVRMLLFYWFAAWAAPQICFAADEVFDMYDTGNGLSQATVHCVLQDSRGYLWIGTDDGLNRYDGTQFVQFHSDPSDLTTLSNGAVWSLLEDSEGFIWVGTQKAGLNRYNRRTGAFEQMLSDSLQQVIHGDAIVCILQDSLGGIWAGTTKSGLIYLPKGDDSGFVLNGQSQSLPSNRIRCLARDGADHILVGTSNYGLIRLDIRDRSWVPMVMENGETPPFINVQNLVQDASGGLWLATLDAGVEHCIREPRTPERVRAIERIPGLDVQRVRALSLDRRNTLWIATASDGLAEFRLDSRELLMHKHDHARATSLAEDNLLCVLHDRSEDLWIGTWSSGLSRLRLRNTPFAEIKPETGEGIEAGVAMLALAFADNGTLLAGTVGQGLIELDLGPDSVTTHKVAPGEFATTTITSILWLTADSFLVGTYNEGLFVYDHGTKLLTRFGSETEFGSLQDFSVLCIARDRANQIWLGTVNHGAIQISADLARATFFKKREDGSGISDYIVYALYADPKGRVWIGTLDGLNCVDGSGEVIMTLRYDRADTNSISNNEIRAIASDSRGNLWVGTSNGINRISEDGTSVKRITERSGLANGVIYGLLVDAQDNVWVSTNRGISVIRADGARVENYYGWDGLPLGEFNQGAYVRSADGALLFGGSAAITKFYPDQVQAKTLSVVITSVRDYQTNEYLSREPGVQEKLTLPHWRKHLVIDFSAIEFYGGVQRGYSYRMSGLANDWIRNVSSNSAVFTNLEPGDYAFEVKREGADDDAATRLRISVQPPWWLRSEAILVWLLAGSGLLFWAFRYAQRRAVRQATVDAEKRAQLIINRRYLLESLSVIGHNQTTRDCFDAIVRNCNRLRDPADTHAVARLKSEAAGYLAHTSDKIDKLAVQVPLAEVEAQFADPLLAEARQMDRLVRLIANEEDVEQLRRQAPAVAESVETFLRHFRTVIGFLSRIYKTKLDEAFGEVCRNKSVEFERRGIEVTVDCPPDLVCFVDRLEFVAVLDDLLSNSMEALSASSEKRISIVAKEVEEFRGKIEVLIADSGRGLNLLESEWGTIFERRYSTKPGDTGGLGLYNAKQTMLRYQGDIGVKASSEAGTTIRLYLKRASL